METISRRNFIGVSLCTTLGGLSSSEVSASVMEDESSSRFNRGLSKLSEVDGRAGEEVIKRLETISPDLARYVVEYPFGDVYSRPGLTLREREFVTVAALAALGNATPQLKVHLNASLNVGITAKELEEVMIQMSVYAGFPAALNGIFALDEVLKEHNSR